AVPATAELPARDRSRRTGGGLGPGPGRSRQAADSLGVTERRGGEAASPLSARGLALAAEHLVQLLQRDHVLVKDGHVTLVPVLERLDRFPIDEGVLAT